MSTEMNAGGHGGRLRAGASEFVLSVSLEGMDPEDDFRVVLPIGYTRNSVGWLLDQVFPEDEHGSSTVESFLDVVANPDMPEIYAVMLQVTKEWRMGLCTLSVSTAGQDKLDLADPASNHLVRPSPDNAPPDGHDDGVAPPVGAHGGRPCLGLRVAQEYSALEYAVAQGFWQSRDELLAWLRELTVLYFMDKFEYDLTEADPDSGGDPVPGIKALQDEDLIATCEDTGSFFITEDGRGVIGRLLAETESYIDQYDHFKDVDFDGDADEVCFDRGRGVDLRAQVFISDGLDPVRTVFLLRLYDGAMDEFESTWTRLIEDEGFFGELLEPVVNRYNVSENLIGKVIDAGYGYIEERHEEARQLAAEREIAGRVRDAARSDSHEQDHGRGDDHRALDESNSHVPLPHQGAGNPDVGKQQ